MVLLFSQVPSHRQMALLAIGWKYPRAAASLWKKMGQLSGGRPPQFLSTHPSPENRQQTLAKLAQQMMPLYQAKGERPSYNY